MGLRGVYVQPARSFRFACVFRRSLREGPGANHYSCLRHDFLPAMEDWLDVRKEHENGRVSSPHRKTQRAHDEAGVLLYAPAVWQSTHTAESAFGAIANRIRSVLFEDRQPGQKATAAA